MKKILSLLLATSLILSACQSKTLENTQEESSLSKKVYVAVENDNQVAVVDPVSGMVTKRIDLSGMPHNVQVSPDGATVWVTVNAMEEGEAEMHSSEDSLGTEDQLVVISTETDTIIQQIDLGADLHLAHVVLSPDSAWAYTNAQEANKVFIVNAQTYTFEKTIELPEGAEPHGLRLDPEGNLAYLALMGAKGMGILNLETEAFEVIDFGDAVVQTGVTPDGKYAFASLYSTKQLGIYNIETKETSTVPLPDAKGPVQVYSTPDSRYVYVADQGYYFDQPTSDKVYKIDLESKTVVATIVAGEGPHGVALSSDVSEAYITNIVSGDLSIINTETDQVIKTIDIGEAPNGVTVWESGIREPSVSLTPVDSISHPHGLAVDIKDSNKVYVATHEGLLLLQNEQDLYRIGESTNDLMGFTIDALDSKTFYSSGHPSYGGNIGFQKTVDGGKTWEKISDGINGPVDFHTMTVSPVDSNIVYGLFSGQIQKSTDGGKSWTLLNNQPEKIIALVADVADVKRAYATTQQGIWMSTDGGENWSVLSDQLKSSIVISMVQNPKDGTQMLSFSDTLGLASSSDGGKTWTSIMGTPNAVLYFIAFSASNPQMVYAIDENNQVYKSEDSGLTWEKIY
jgi:YVTN family beta-propeller protein